ncbi:L,D-transpeptidase family protein [Streptomyces sp.]|uniref:L,D-transpeptidase family protein n=1 Tax=Streptomyces sp. TaxID=1931 RepID=UPI002F40AB7E
MTVAVVAAALAVLTACGPQDTGADPKAPGTPPTTSAGPTPTATPSPLPTTAPPTTPVPTTPVRTPVPTPVPTTTAPSTPPVAPALMSVGSSSARVRELQARLGQLGFFSRTPTGYYGTVTQHAVRDFQERHGLADAAGTGSVSPTTWARLKSLTRQPTHQEMYPAPPAKAADTLDPRCLTGHAMCVSKTTRTLSWVVDGKVLASMDVRFGSQYTPTREGLFHVTFKSRDHVSTLYDTPMPYAMFFSGGEAVHYSADFAARGYAGASHGCVNVRDRAAIASLFDQVHVGDKVVVHW